MPNIRYKPNIRWSFAAEYSVLSECWNFCFGRTLINTGRCKFIWKIYWNGGRFINKNSGEKNKIIGGKTNKNWIVRRPGAIRSEVGTADMKFVPLYLLRQLATTIKIQKKLSKSSQKVVKKLSKVVKKLSKKLLKSCQKLSKVVKKLSKSC
jgi:hypothetical protein